MKCFKSPKSNTNDLYARIKDFCGNIFYWANCIIGRDTDKLFMFAVSGFFGFFFSET